MKIIIVKNKKLRINKKQYKENYSFQIIIFRENEYKQMFGKRWFQLINSLIPKFKLKREEKKKTVGKDKEKEKENHGKT